MGNLCLQSYPFKPVNSWKFSVQFNLIKCKKKGSSKATFSILSNGKLPYSGLLWERKSFLEYGAAVLETHSVCNKREMAFVFTAVLEYGAAVLEVDSVYNERERDEVCFHSLNHLEFLFTTLIYTDQLQH